MSLKAAVGDEVGIHYDADHIVCVGDFIVTNTGRCYKVVKLRVQTRGFHEGRYHLRCVVMKRLPRTSRSVHKLFWYPRN